MSVKMVEKDMRIMAEVNIGKRGGKILKERRRGG